MSSIELKFLALQEHPGYRPTLVRWTRQTWPTDRTDEEIDFRIYGAGQPGELPSALVSLVDERPVGFVSLVLYEKGIALGRPHWIDALYIVPEYRRQGLAYKSILRAEKHARLLGLPQLFALTDIPALYEKAGWVKIEGEADGSDSILQRDL